MLAKERKQEVIKTFQKHEADTGSSEVQIALLTERIKTISAHLKDHKKDNATKVGLLGLVGQRFRLLFGQASGVDHLPGAQHLVAHSLIG